MKPGLAALLLPLLISACLTVPSEPGIANRTTTSTPGGESRQIEKMREYLENGTTRFNQGAFSEGIQQLIAVLAEAESLPAKNPEASNLVRRAEIELAKIQAGLSLEAGLEWMDEAKNQISASVLDLGTEKALNPSIILAYNYGSGKALVSGAPILFEFKRGEGRLSSPVMTNEYGQASTTVTQVQGSSEELVIMASVAFTAKSFRYRFSGVERDFVFIPPSNRAVILVLERSRDLIPQDPVILDAVFNRLKGSSFNLSHYNGVLMGKDFDEVFGGDRQAIRRLALEQGVAYLVLVLSDCIMVSQVELEGKKYNIFKSQVVATTRIMRVADGKILYSATIPGISGQGGSSPKAVLDGFRQAAEQMSGRLQQDLPKIRGIPAGKPS